MKPLVSIVLPTYNGERFIEDSINSVIAQTYTNWELIIVNDCSTDKTLEIAQNYTQKDNRIRIISNKENIKLPASLNVGFKNANGKYYTWTSDDNMYRENAIEFMVDYLENNNNIDLVSCKFDYVDESKNYIGHFHDYGKRCILELTKRCNVGACFMYTKDIAQKVGEYDEEMFCAEDYEYWCRIALNGNIKYLDENLYIYRQNSKSLTATKQDIIQKKLLEIRSKYAISITKKYNLKENEIIYMLIKFYFEKKQIEFLLQAFKMNFIKTIYNYMKFVSKPITIPFKFYFLIHQLKDKKIAFWGASLFLENFLSNFHIKNKNIVGIIDKNPDRKGEVLSGYKIYSPDDIGNLNIDNIIFAIPKKHELIYPQIDEYLQEKHPKINLLPDMFE